MPEASESNWRLFVALRVPESVRLALARTQAEIRPLVSTRCASWPKPENLHLTLRFLGSVTSGRVEALGCSLRQCTLGLVPLELGCERLGCFPDLNFPRVLWAGVSDLEATLPRLANRVSEAVAAFAEKPAGEAFVGHITLGRFKRLRRVEAERVARAVATGADRCFGKWRCAEIELMRSELSSAGSRYTTLETFHLGNDLEFGLKPKRS